MVMDASPSPQSVGREFVRQYYTLLNKAPNHLHRFYNHQSSFVHDGLEPNNRESGLVIGQKQIYNRIQQLNFRDCHAKISQVESQATLGNGVVVQVTGELSNDGQPMRRFTQTFVLAAETPKKYYVHNDIFRYQDVYSDDEVDADSERSENDAEIETTAVTGSVEEQPPLAGSAMQQSQQAMYYPLVAQQQITQTVQMNGVVHDEMLQATHLPVSPTTGTVAVTPTVAPNSGVLPMDPSVAQAAHVLTAPQQVAKEPPTHQLPPVAEVSVIEAAEKAKAAAAVAVSTEEPTKEQSVGKEDDLTQRVIQSEPTYANLVKSGGAPPGGLSFASAMTQATATAPPQHSSSLGITQQPIAPVNLTRHVTSPPPVKYENNSGGYRGGSSSNERDVGGPLPQRSGNNMPPRPVRERRSSNTNQGVYSDMQQLFLGNIPHQATEEELRPLFAKYGTVLELRILSKSNTPKIIGRGPPPNYGFITFAEPEAATNCHSENNIVYQDGSAEGQKLNIELKKTKPRGEMGGSGDRDRRVMGGGMPGNGTRSNMNSGSGLGGGMRGSNSAGGGMMRSGGNRNLGGNNGSIRGNSFNRSDRMGGPMGGRSSDGDRSSATIGSGGGNLTYGRR
ncbi:Ras GTPase-activating protein-binding protein [Sergentomyia squamirostris]